MRKSADVIALAIVAALAVWVSFCIHDFGSGGMTWLWTPLYAGFLSLFLLPLVIWRFKRVKLVIYLAFLLSAVVFAVVPTTSRDFFVRRLDSLQPGMTISQVDVAMRQYSGRRYDGGVVRRQDRKWLPEKFANADRVVSFRHSDDSAYNADVGTVFFSNGRVLGTEFSPD